jgi:outer membrane protein
MKRLFSIILSIIGFTTFSRAQMAFVDTKYILSRIPDYQDSLAKLNQLGVVWQKEIDDKQAVLDKMYTDFERDAAMLTDAMTKKRTDDIYYHEKEVRDLQRLRFGFEGDMYKKGQELLRPFQDKVNGATKIVAIRMGYTIVLDKSEGITVIFSKSTLDITGEVEKELGLR